MKPTLRYCTHSYQYNMALWISAMYVCFVNLSYLELPCEFTYVNWSQIQHCVKRKLTRWGKKGVRYIGMATLPNQKYCTTLFKQTFLRMCVIGVGDYTWNEIPQECSSKHGNDSLYSMYIKGQLNCSLCQSSVSAQIETNPI